MPIYQLHPDFIGFPPRSEFDQDIVAVGGDLRSDRLIEAYSRGIFPWYNEPGDMHWYCPAERCILPVSEVTISHSMRSILKRDAFRYSMDSAFSEVIAACREGEREGNTWIHDEIMDAYSELNRRGLAHSVEVWQGKKLVGGLYGIALGSMFFGESMFSRASNSSKAALIVLCRFLPHMGIELVDCQVPNDHLMSMGAEIVTRDAFLDNLEAAIQLPTAMGSWDAEFAQFMKHGINKRIG